MTKKQQSRQLAKFCANVTFDDIPENIVECLLNLMADWAGSCLAGSHSRQTQIFHQLAKSMGPQSGPCRIIGTNASTSPLFAAMINAASSHVVEQDDLHNSSILHPATVVFPPLFAVAESLNNVSGKEMVAAAAVGYEAGIRVGEFLGLAHYRIFHMTGTSGTIAAAMAVANLLKLNEEETLNALGSAGTQAAGLWAFLGDAADSKQLHTAKASSDGLLAAWTARDGLTGAKSVLEDEQGMGAGMLASGSAELITKDLGTRWALAETSFKWHASCRHTHPAADAMHEIMRNNQLDVNEIESVVVEVYQAAFDVLGAVKTPQSVHQSKFSMGFVLALIAIKGIAGVKEFTDGSIQDPTLLAFHDKVSMVVDGEINRVYPEKWCSRVVVRMVNGKEIRSFIDTPRGDPGYPLSREDISYKACALVEYYETCSRDRMLQLLDDIWTLPKKKNVAGLFG
ncbi:MAG: MmgE/PrpD family protein [Acidiferrobacterales bacterium]|nr:MmgE/PrpD family protein [Acidiferrobacterales bacterium]